MTTFRAFRHANYRRFWYGMLVSLVGTWMQGTAQSFLVYEMTGSALRTGMVMFAFTLPSLLFSLFGGAIADRYDRRRLLVGTQIAFMTSAAVLATLTLTGVVQVWHILVLAFANGVTMAVDAPARQAMLPTLVGREDLQNAVALNAAVFNGSRIFGPALAGIVYKIGGPGWCFAVNAISYLAVIWPLVRMRLVMASGDAPSEPMTAQIRDGLAYVRSHAAVRSLLLLLAGVGTFGFAWMVLAPAFTVRVLGMGPVENGYLLTATGVGATAGALTVATLQGLRRPGVFVVTCATLAGGMLVAFSFTRALPVALLALGVVGFFLTAFMSSTNSTIQSLVEDRYRGRVMSLYTLALIGSGPVGSLLAGSVADALGVPTSLAINGALVVVCAALTYLLAPAVVGLRVVIPPHPVSLPSSIGTTAGRAAAR
ncbi:MAG: MFS transporter [Armatimonadota bacterium]|nr:MFS transporter [Armatimonadota bacterium]MDR5697002.1 MFS transporter [Armatimonadota bacterium]